MVRLRVTLLASQNRYLRYPAKGVIDIIETATDDTVIRANFKPDGTTEHGYPCPFVQVREPHFEVVPA